MEKNLDTNKKAWIDACLICKKHLLVFTETFPATADAHLTVFVRNKRRILTKVWYWTDNFSPFIQVTWLVKPDKQSMIVKPIRGLWLKVHILRRRNSLNTSR